MPYNLVIVESSTKAHVIAKYLNESDELRSLGKFKVVASQGHVRDISKKKMGIDMNTFDCDFIIIENKRQIVSNLKKQIENAHKIYLAADNDREGEGIAWHLKEHFKLKSKKYERILFNEITKKALVYAVLNPVDIDKNMVDAYLTRRIVDRFVGFMITKLLWKSFSSNVTLSAGRVQSATLKIIMDKEKDVIDFVSEPYWTIRGDFGNHLSDTTLYYNNVIWKINDNNIVNKVLSEKLSRAIFKLKSCNVKNNIKEKPPLPFTTSSLQQVGYGEFGSITRIMAIAQQLYEMGAITYMRTDSTSINTDMINNIKKHIEDKYSSSYVSERIVRSGKQKHAQEAHEAIRPTTLKYPFSKKMTVEQQNMYTLIYKRTIAAFMSDVLYTEATVYIENDQMSKDYMFIGKHKIIQFQGWLKIYNNDGKYEESNVDGFVSKCKKMQHVGAKTITGRCTWTIPPSRYNESSLVNILEKSGIGRPSTYASIISKLVDKMYIQKAKEIQGKEKKYISYILDVKKKQKIITEVEEKFVGSEKNKLVPLNIGTIVNEYVSNAFQNITDAKFTSEMESNIDLVSKGGLYYKKFLQDFYKKDFEIRFLNAMALIKKNTGDTNKQQLGQEEIEINDKKIVDVINDSRKTCILRTTRYGHVIEIRTKDSSEKSVYINIKPYLQETNKKLKDLTVDEIKTFISLPLNLKYKNDYYSLLFGRYGFYIKSEERNHKIYKNLLGYVFSGNYELLMKSLKL